MIIRAEQSEDFAAIRDIVEVAFRASNPHGNRGHVATEHLIIAALRNAGALTLGLVAQDGGQILGHIAFSPVLIDGRGQGWHGLAPLAVRPDRQNAGIGTSLVREGLAQLIGLGSAGCVVLGSPDHYAHFGFAVHPELRYLEAPPGYFMAQSFGTALPRGVVCYHAAFSDDRRNAVRSRPSDRD